MFTISIIVAVDQNNAIGKNNQLLCHLPADLKYFKQTTSGKTIIMGRKTFESLPNGALPNRRNIVLSRNETLGYAGCEIYPTLDEALKLAGTDDDEVFIIGGGKVYNEAFDRADKLYVTRIHHGFEGADTFFPAISDSDWRIISQVDCEADDKNKYAYSFLVYERIVKKQ